MRRERQVLNVSPEDWKGQLKEVGGSQSDDLNHILINQAYSALWTAHSDDDDKKAQQIATCAALHGIGPKDEVEGMLATQMVGLHNAAMEVMRRAMIKEQPFEVQREYLAQASKLTRSYAALVEALNRHRGKGQQKVTVEHIHVHAGGQAVVGVVEAPGGRGAEEIGRQPHANQIADAPIPSMRSQDAEREALPVACDAERALSDARGTIARRA
jgi:hypothetical protein